MPHGRLAWIKPSLALLFLLAGARVGDAAWRFSILAEQWQGEPESLPSLAVPNPISHDDEVQRVTLQEAIALALENNPRIAARRLEPLRQTAGVLGAESQFDPVFSADVQAGKNETPAGSALSGNDRVIADDRYANFKLQKLLRTGANLSLDFKNDRLDVNSRFQGLRPQYKSEVGFTLVQPLLRNLGWNFSYLVVRAAHEQAAAAAYQYEADLENFVREVIEAYWQVVGAREAVGVRRKSLDLANRTVQENQARVKVGLLAPVAVLEAQADLKSREADLLRDENALAVSRQRLSQLAFYRPLGTFVPRTLEPVESITPEAVAIDLDDTLAIALKERPEIIASSHGVVVTQLNERIASNQLLPRLDLVGSYGQNAISGATGTQATSFTAIGDDEVAAYQRRGCVCQENICRDDACPLNPIYKCICSVRPKSTFGGTRADTYDRLGDFRTYSFGIRLEVPFANAAAESKATQTRISRDQAELNHRELLSQITLEVRQSVSDVQTAKQRIDATRVARELAEENLRNQEQRHSVGAATTKDLLDFQTRLTNVGFAEVQAKVDYATAIARWRRAEGRLLEHYQIVFERPGSQSPSWFARF